MFITQVESHRLTKKQSDAEVLERVLDALESHGLADIGVQIYCDGFDHTKRSPVKTAIKKIPALAPFERPHPDQEDCTLLTNVDAFWEESAAETRDERVTWTSARAIAAGIPRSFSFFHARFLFSPLPILALAGDTPPSVEDHTLLYNWRAQLPPGIYFSSDWGSSSRERYLVAVAHRPVPEPDVRKLPPLTGSSRSLMDALGKPSRVETRLWYTAAEHQPVVEAAMRTRDIELPEFVAPESVSDRRELDGAGSLKDAIVAALKPLKFRYQSKLSGYGTGVLSRRSRLHHEILVEYDWGPNSKEVFARLHIRGAGFAECTSLPIGGVDGKNPFVASPEAVAAVARNLAHSVAVMEEQWVPRVEALMEPSPAWYKPNSPPQNPVYNYIW